MQNATKPHFLILIILISALAIFNCILLINLYFEHSRSKSIIPEILLPRIRNISLTHVSHETHPNYTSLLAMSKEKYKLISDQYFGIRRDTMVHSRGPRGIHSAFAKFDADWPCVWSENVIGNKEGDGVKWGCGIKFLQAPCVIYSLGSSDQWQFEEDLISMASHCKIFTFDPKYARSSITIPQSLSNNLEYFHFGVTGNSSYRVSKTKEMWKFKSLPEIMSDLNHTHIDILKIDVEEAEWGIFSQMEETFKLETEKTSSIFHFLYDRKDKQSWPSIGQIYIEFHFPRPLKGNEKENFDNFRRIIELFEKHGFRIFHKEVNARFAECCSEYSFIQAKWNPNIKYYPMNR